MPFVVIAIGLVWLLARQQKPATPPPAPPVTRPPVSPGALTLNANQAFENAMRTPQTSPEHMVAPPVMQAALEQTVDPPVQLQGDTGPHADAPSGGPTPPQYAPPVPSGPQYVPPAGS